MSELNLKTQNIQAVDLETKSQLAKVKKLITANNADSFALAVELVRTLGLDNEATWLSLLAKSRIAQLVKLADSRVTNLLLEIAGAGKGIRIIIFGNLHGRRGGFDLSGLTSLSDAAAQALAQHEGCLELSGLMSLSDAAAQALAEHKENLWLSGLTSLSDAAAQALAKHNGFLDLRGLTSLSDAVAQALAKHEGMLELGGLKSLSDAAAQALGQHEEPLKLSGLTSLSDSAAQALAKHNGFLQLSGLKSLSDAAAQALGQHEGTLQLGLSSLSDAAAQALARHEGDLELNDLEGLSDAAAQALAMHNGFLELRGLTSLSDSPGHVALAQKLARCERWLALDGLTSLSDAAAQMLAQRKGGLYLGGFSSGVEKIGRARRRLTGARLFESEDSDSSKFWDTELRGAELVVRFGRLGTDGQEKIKAFPDAAVAATEQANLIEEKLGKGYKEV